MRLLFLSGRDQDESTRLDAHEKLACFISVKVLVLGNESKMESGATFVTAKWGEGWYVWSKNRSDERGDTFWKGKVLFCLYLHEKSTRHRK
jgi:hypothetical protein